MKLHFARQPSEADLRKEIEGAGLYEVEEDCIYVTDVASDFEWVAKERESRWSGTYARWAFKNKATQSKLYDNTICAEMFEKLTGIKLAPGEFVTLEFKEVDG